MVLRIRALGPDCWLSWLLSSDNDSVDTKNPASP